jgi:uncharacterized protein (TIGR02391 family)
MGRQILDPKLLEKIAKARKTDTRAARVVVSKKAAKLGISSEAALVVLAKQHSIGTAHFQKSLDSVKQTEIREALSSNSLAREQPSMRRNATAAKVVRPIGNKTVLRSSIETLIEDPTLLSRCKDLLLANGKFDRPISEATKVLEDRIRKKAQPTARLVGENLVSFAFNEDLAKTRLRMASGDPDDQRGFTQLLRGSVPAFRNITHHHVVDTFTREDALRICGLIDLLIRVVDNSVRVGA